MSQLCCETFAKWEGIAYVLTFQPEILNGQGRILQGLPTVPVITRILKKSSATMKEILFYSPFEDDAEILSD